MPNALNNTTTPEAAKVTTERRRQREPRFPLAIHIEVSGIDGSGQPFYENTVTSNVSRSGCRFKLSRQLDKDSIVAIRVLRTLAGKAVEPCLVMFQVMYTQMEKEGWAVGAWTLQSDVTWCSDIPDDPKPEGAE